MNIKPESKRFLFYTLPPWLWGMGIFVGTSLPADYLPEFVLFGPDKFFHMGVFLIFSILIFRALSVRERTLTPRQTIVWTLLIAGSYAVFDELHQYFVPGRAPDLYDILADSVGIAIGTLLAVFNKKTLGLRPRGVGVDSQKTPLS